jgi:hypothetical protein
VALWATRISSEYDMKRTSYGTASWSSDPHSKCRVEGCVATLVRTGVGRNTKGRTTHECMVISVRHSNPP